MNINDYIQVKNYIPKKLCKDLISFLKKQKWTKHKWYNLQTNTSTSEDTKELDVLYSNQNIQNILSEYIVASFKDYNNKYNVNKDNDKTAFFCSSFSPVRFNQYKKGTLMRKHFDHIHSIFDGKKRGIPAISIIGILNEDYQGGELVINDKKIKTKIGDIVIFPSCFMYPHEIKEIKKGTRYSFITWGF
jgi:hypothetical protein